MLPDGTPAGQRTESSRKSQSASSGDKVNSGISVEDFAPDQSPHPASAVSHPSLHASQQGTAHVSIHGVPNPPVRHNSPYILASCTTLPHTPFPVARRRTRLQLRPYSFHPEITLSHLIVEAIVPLPQSILVPAKGSLSSPLDLVSQIHNPPLGRSLIPRLAIPAPQTPPYSRLEHSP